VDNEAVVVAHSQLVLEGNDRAVMLQADITEPHVVLHAPETRRTLDFSKPIGLLAVTIGHHISPERKPVQVFDTYRDALVPGSHLAITHWTNDHATEGSRAAAEAARGHINVFPRDRAEVMALFGDFKLVEPGLVSSSQWRPERGDDVAKDQGRDQVYAGVARKP
jgi:hypothetical protein